MNKAKTTQALIDESFESSLLPALQKLAQHQILRVPPLVYILLYAGEGGTPLIPVSRIRQTITALEDAYLTREAVERYTDWQAHIEQIKLIDPLLQALTHPGESLVKGGAVTTRVDHYADVPSVRPFGEAGIAACRRRALLSSAAKSDVEAETIQWATDFAIRRFDFINTLPLSDDPLLANSSHVMLHQIAELALRAHIDAKQVFPSLNRLYQETIAPATQTYLSLDKGEHVEAHNGFLRPLYAAFSGAIKPKGRCGPIDWILPMVTLLIDQAACPVDRETQGHIAQILQTTHSLETEHPGALTQYYTGMHVPCFQNTLSAAFPGEGEGATAASPALPDLPDVHNFSYAGSIKTVSQDMAIVATSKGLLHDYKALLAKIMPASDNTAPLAHTPELQDKGSHTHILPPHTPEL